MSDFLVPEHMLATLDKDIGRLAASGDEAFTVDHDELYGVAFRRYLLFSRWSRLLTEAGLRLSEEGILYNSYYWMLRFSRLHALTHGYDAGIEQQAFEILAQASCEVDWGVIEQITSLVDKEIAEAGKRTGVV